MSTPVIASVVRASGALPGAPGALPTVLPGALDRAPEGPSAAEMTVRP
jgi:hypothetical protein